jgi:hypothetical protein
VKNPRAPPTNAQAALIWLKKTARDISFRREPIGCSRPVEQRIGGDPFPERA